VQHADTIPHVPWPNLGSSRQLLVYPKGVEETLLGSILSHQHPGYAESSSVSPAAPPKGLPQEAEGGSSREREEMTLGTSSTALITD
jgi:hypothetical protein